MLLIRRNKMMKFEKIIMLLKITFLIKPKFINIIITIIIIVIIAAIVIVIV